MTGLTLSKDERLRSLKDIDLLFADGFRLSKYPLLLIAKEVEGQESPAIKILFSVSKRKFKKAVDRNRIKRLMREVFRHQKQDWLNALAEGKHFHFAIVFTGNELPTLHTIQRSFTVLQSKWKDKDTSQA